jgi:phenylpyruvate tautomerase PptA (4-oxalocrotonate tautomerase family)
MTTPTPEEYAALVRRIEQALNEHPQFNDAQVRVLLDVVEAHVWRAGLWSRIRWAANVIGALGILAGGFAVAASAIGYEVIRK